MRTRPPLRDGVSSYFGQLNAGKRSLVLDLKQPAAVEVVKRLVGGADLVVENFRPGVMKRLGLDYEVAPRRAPRTRVLRHVRLWPDRALLRTARVRARHPRRLRLRPRASVVPGRPHAAGQQRRLHRRRADRHLCLRRHRRRALPPARHRAGADGRRVDAREHADDDALRGSARAVRHGAARPADVRAGADAGRLSDAGGGERAHVPGPGPRGGRPDWIEDPRFAAYADRRLNWHLFMDELEQWSRQLAPTSARRRSSGSACRPRATARSRRRWRTPSSPIARPSPRSATRPARSATLNPPFRFSDAPAAARPFASRLGEHTDAVLAEAGYARGEIDAFRKAGALG